MRLNKLLILSLSFSALLLSCGKNNNNSSELINFSSLTGTFTKDKAIKTNSLGEDLRIYNNLDSISNNDMYTSSVYPLNTVNGTKVSYSYSQSLRLKRDYTYEYSYIITLTNSEEWGKDFASLEVDMKGIFEEPISSDELNYSVKLLDPTEGTMKIYGCTISGEGSIFAWSKNTAATYSLDIGYELLLNSEYDYNRFIEGRLVTCIKGEDRILEDDIYYHDILNDIAPYCDYTF